MTQFLPKMIAVVGETASGKSDLAVELALLFGGEIISADSRQVYRGMNIGTGKILFNEMKGIPHHLLDIADPTHVISLGEYKVLAEKAIDEILQRNHLPILCGGTGFYIDAVADGVILPDVPPDATLRNSLAGKPVDELFSILRKLDPERAKHIDPKNPHRLVRAIEIATTLGKVPRVERQKKYQTLFIGIKLPDDVLRARIHDRLLKRMSNGMFDEVNHLHASGVSFERMEELGLEYRYLSRLARGILNEEEALKQLETKIYQYAKRQRTWFKRNPEITWLEGANTQRAKELVTNFLNS